MTNNDTREQERTEQHDDQRPYAFKWTSKWDNEEMCVTDGSFQFWADQGQLVTIVTWGPETEQEADR